MKKIIIIIQTLILISCFGGCSINDTAKQESSSSENTKSEDLSDDELKLGVTQKGKEDFISRYSQDAYDTAMACVPMMLNLYDNEHTQIEEKDITELSEEYDVSTVTIKSSQDGHAIPADFITDGNTDCDTVIMIHGAGENRRKSADRAKMFLDLGCNVLQYDQRSSGDNTAPLTTYGILEKYDLFDCVNYIDSQISTDKKIILYGKSMGGAAAEAFMGEKYAADLVDYVILDCPVVSMKEFVDMGIRKYCPDEYVEQTYEYSDDFMDCFLGFTFADGEASVTAADCEIPLLMFASEGDECLNYDTQKKFFDSLKNTRKYLYTSHSSKHCCIFSDENEKFRELTGKLISGVLV